MTDQTQKILDEIKAKRGYLYPWQELLAKEDPDFIKNYEKMWDTIGARSVVLPQKIKQIILVAVLASKTDEVALRTQIKRAFSLGATKQELIEAIEVAFIPGGALTLVHGLKALLDVMQELGIE
ncbi:MAG TPA: carboxymuconolactone decarboxylase family protein [Candidatus Limnocylindrales bacterium]|jgi:alkylhydroperoxidase/carboxymuconolactone decarboxylase family protein YurZ|nr:carboxymuconolactone decarboxylase family protein [Candidatus Limnocylindrales bacterium]